MKNRILAMFAVLCVAVACCSAFSAPVIASQAKDSVSAASQQSNVLSARFLNMLNHNFVYGADFEDAGVMAEKSVYPLLSSRQGDYISCTVISSFVKDMYGVEITDMSALSEGYPEKSGYLYIVPCGFTSYEHKEANVVMNEDGSYTVTTSVTVQPHDGEACKAVCTSLFVRNVSSSFGFNIISSDIIQSSNAHFA